jgi:hypothetical protein
VISGSKVEIGLPNAPVPVATATQVNTVKDDLTYFQVDVTREVKTLQKNLADLDKRFRESIVSKWRR